MPGIVRRALLGGVLALPTLARPGLARWAPARAVSLIVPFAEGGANDEVMRALAEGMARRLGQTVEVVNKPGRRGVRAIAGLANAAPDGLLLAQLPASAIRLALIENLPFVATRDTTPILSVAGTAFGSIAKTDRFAEGWKGFIEEAREKPGVLSYGSGGVNSTGHLTMARLLLRERVQAVHVPFRGAMNGAQALIAGDIDVMAGPAVIGDLVTRGEATWLNVWSAERLHRWPDAPTLRDLGYRLVVTAPFGIVGPPRLPDEISAAIHDAVLGTMRDESFTAMLEQMDMTEDYRDGPAYAAFIAESARTEERLIGRLGLLP